MTCRAEFPSHSKVFILVFSALLCGEFGHTAAVTGLLWNSVIFLKANPKGFFSFGFYFGLFFWQMTSHRSVFVSFLPAILNAILFFGEKPKVFGERSTLKRYFFRILFNNQIYKLHSSWVLTRMFIRTLEFKDCFQAKKIDQLSAPKA